MRVPGTFVKRPILLDRLMERRSAAFVCALSDTCRAWPALADWLCEEFPRNAKVRESFRKLVATPSAVDPSTDGLLENCVDTSGRQNEVARLKAQFGIISPQLYGGRTWTEMELLLRRYQAGSLDLGVFMLARHWKKLGDRARFTPELQRAGVELLDGVIRHGETRLWANLFRVVALLTHTNKANLRGTFGYADWWKLNAVLYMMRWPRYAYRTREVRAHLAKLEISISSLDFRRFCKRHSIRRDERAGRPRKHD